MTECGLVLSGKEGYCMDDALEKFSDERRDEPPTLEGVDSTASTKIDYSFCFTGWPTLTQIVTIAVATAGYTALSWVSLLVPSPSPTVGTIFFAIGFGIAFAIWFSGWALAIGFLGNFIGAGLFVGTPALQALAFGTTDFIQLGVPMLLYRLFARRFGVSPIGKDVFTVRGFIFFLLAAVLPNNILGGAYGNMLLIRFGITPPDSFSFYWAQWSLSNIIVTIVIGSVLLATVGPLVERFGLTVRNQFR
jgi:hypothetical protein